MAPPPPEVPFGSALDERHEPAPAGPEALNTDRDQDGTPVSGAGAGAGLPPPPPPLAEGKLLAAAEADRAVGLHGDQHPEAEDDGLGFDADDDGAEEVDPGRLPADLLRRIAGHLDDAADFVRFYSVCKSWRSAACPPGSTLLPWLLAPRYGDDDRLLRFRLVFSASTLHLACPASLAVQSVVMDTNSVATRGRLFVIGPAHDAWLANPLGGGGATTPLPRLPDHLWLDEATCSVSADGSTVVMCTGPPCPARRVPVVLATILRQEDEACPCPCPWMDVTVHWPALQSSPVLPLPYPRFYALYHRGQVICSDEETTCICVLPISDHAYCGAGMAAVWVRPPPLPTGKVARYTFVLESGEELLWARVLIPTCYMLGQKVFSNEDPVYHHLSVSVHALQLQRSGNGGEVCWVNKEFSMGDRALFLSPRSSFSMEGVRAAASGCAYFLYDNLKNSATKEHLCSVYRYEFLSGISSLVEELPPGWNANSVWFAPQPIVTAWPQ